MVTSTLSDSVRLHFWQLICRGNWQLTPSENLCVQYWHVNSTDPELHTLCPCFVVDNVAPLYDSSYNLFFFYSRIKIVFFAIILCCIHNYIWNVLRLTSALKLNRTLAVYDGSLSRLLHLPGVGSWNLYINHGEF